MGRSTQDVTIWDEVNDNYAEVNSEGRLKVDADIDISSAYTDFITGNITIGTTAVEAMVGVSRLSGRKELTFFNNSNRVVYYGFDDGVSESNGFPVLRNQFVSIPVGDVAVWIVSTHAGVDVRVGEFK